MLSALGASLVSLTGCLGQISVTDSENVADIQIDNETSEELTMTLRIVAGGERVLRETFTLAANGPDHFEPEKTYTEVVGTETATVRVTVENGPEGTYEFTDTELDARTLYVDIYANQIQFQVAVA